MNRQVIFLVDDDRLLTDGLAAFLGRSGYDVRTAHSLGEAELLLSKATPHLMLLDLTMPDGDGTDFCSRLRKEHYFPILMLTSRGTSLDKIQGLEVGADDYVTKPFHAKELLARIRAHLRRQTTFAPVAQEPIVEAGDLVLDRARRTITCQGEEISLTPNEFTMLKLLILARDLPVKKELFCEAIWSGDENVPSNNLEVIASRLRRKLEACGSGVTIQSLRRFGYKLCV